jgi:hypothetical protein
MTCPTCHHVYDTGKLCQSVAISGRHYCLYHLRHRGLRMRMAQARARNRPAPLQLPPLENMHAVQSALTQVMEALATDMLDTRRAQGIVSVLRVAANNLKRPDAWRPSEYQNVASEDDAAEPSVTSYDDFEAEYGLPKDIDINVPPDLAFPPPSDADSVIVSEERSDESKGPFVSEESIGSTIDVRPDYPISPDTVEVCEIHETQGPDAAQVRCDQLERNRQRRELRSDRRRYAQIALQRNLQIAAKKLALQKLAGERAAQAAQPETTPTKKPPTPATREANPSEAKSIA